jgi:hypothetical protein
MPYRFGVTSKGFVSTWPDRYADEAGFIPV